MPGTAGGYDIYIPTPDVGNIGTAEPKAYDPLFEGNSGHTVADYEGTDPEGYYKWLIENDPDNATAWREKYGSILESNSSVSRYMKQLQDAGINPLYILGNSGISTNAVSSGNSVANYESNRRANAIASQRVGSLAGTGLAVAAIGAIVKLLIALL